MKTEYDIPIEDEIRKDVNFMCNLSEAIEEQGIQKGREEGIVKTIIDMYRNGISTDLIAKITGRNLDEILAILSTESTTEARTLNSF